MSGARPNDPDVAALAALVAVDPVWADLCPARDAMALEDGVVLHAGPAFAEGEVSRPVRNSAAMAALYEGWARSEDEAFGMVASGEITLAPAQDRGAVVPLASVLSPSMQVHVVEDAGDAGNRAYAPINGGGGPALRLGLADAAVVEHLRFLNGELADVNRPAAAARLGLIAIADEALAGGDDCHGRTVEATRLLLASMAEAGIAAASERVRAFFESGPSFFLNLWMAACKCMLAGGGDREGSSAVVAIGGNGNKFGLQVSGLPGRWFTGPATPPEGHLEAGFTLEDRLGAIGDSAVVDAIGLGAMAMDHAPIQREALGAFMPEPPERLGARVLMRAHDRFVRSPIRTGLTARRVVEEGIAPAIALGILDRAGKRGRIGGGIFVPTLNPFANACAALDQAAHGRTTSKKKGWTSSTGG